ncbi:hypothetical protein [Planktothrix agardhii]|uniref:hypothetical protein n=1 Tax=Planktothrix agardhii TaxID=1160 RepID=UPI0020B34934|nr:hypothetical protein [Planktothrix agardhii]MCP9296895.1 hypothetical protein [Planktothrix agardhii LY1]CAD5937410.1 hypothetical protein PCC7811_01703 [Planktothrix agardhii]
MIISDLNYLESANNSAVVGGLSEWSETDTVDITFKTTNSFTLTIDAPCLPDGNFASAGAKASADGDYCGTLNSFTKADTLAVVTYGGASFSGSTSVAAINN